uniref:Ribosomal protein S10 n=1 Tax=Akkesiphycus lubricus TaxID=3022 RepID=A0A8F0FBQ0_AKKLU|nr:ribosomal protein S10 [Akkesiphycus lubricus]
MRLEKKSLTFNCKVWSTSTDLSSLKLWYLLLPLSAPSTGLSTRIKRFTLLRSPLGNKTSKDQFERREYRGYFHIQSKHACEILSLVHALRYSNGVRFKMVVSRSTKDRTCLVHPVLLRKGTL